jgi:hypothetical protein
MLTCPPRSSLFTASKTTANKSGKTLQKKHIRKKIFLFLLCYSGDEASKIAARWRGRQLEQLLQLSRHLVLLVHGMLMHIAHKTTRIITRNENCKRKKLQMNDFVWLQSVSIGRRELRRTERRSSDGFWKLLTPSAIAGATPQQLGKEIKGRLHKAQLVPVEI